MGASAATDTGLLWEDVLGHCGKGMVFGIRQNDFEPFFLLIIYHWTCYLISPRLSFSVN